MPLPSKSRGVGGIGASLWPRIADLPLAIEGPETERLEPGEGFGEAHATRLVRLVGGNEEGCGEDITLFMSDAPAPALEGEWTLASLCAHLASAEQWSEAPEWEMARRWRNWSYESSALDLALRQAGEALNEVLGLEPHPVTFVNSLGLGDPASPDRILRRLHDYSQLRFKLDATPDWTPEIIDVLVGTGAVDTVDFKGHYGMEVEDMPALVSLYERVLGAFPNALVEDPHDLPEVAELLQAHLDRVAYDAPIATVADLDATPLEARTFNIKPSGVGRLETLFELYAECEERGLAIYGGGMGELGVAAARSSCSPPCSAQTARTTSPLWASTRSNRRRTSRRVRCW